MAIDGSLVRRLLAAQHPDLATREIRPAGEGWDNAMFRLGDDLAVRLPRRASGLALLEHERRCFARLPTLPLAVPAPVRVGAPALGYPWPWHVVAWIPGQAWEHDPITGPAESERAALALGAFLRALHRDAPPDLPSHPFGRGRPLPERVVITRGHLDALGPAIEARHPGVWSTFLALVDAPGWTAPPVWLHGDLHPLNVVVHEARVVAVVDFGDCCAGDPAVDLAAAWMFFDRPARAALRAAVHADDDTWSRARAWALAMGLAHLAGGGASPWHAAIGHRTLDAAMDSAEG